MLHHLVKVIALIALLDAQILGARVTFLAGGGLRSGLGMSELSLLPAEEVRGGVVFILSPLVVAWPLNAHLGADGIQAANVSQYLRIGHTILPIAITASGRSIFVIMLWHFVVAVEADIACQFSLVGGPHASPILTIPIIVVARLVAMRLFLFVELIGTFILVKGIFVLSPLPLVIIEIASWIRHLTML